MPITIAQIEEAFGYPLFTNAQYEFMTVTMRHYLLTPWFHATKTDETKKQLWDVVNPLRNRVFCHGCLFYYTLERVQSAIEEGVYLEAREDSPRAYGEEALVILAERVKEELTSKYLYEKARNRMTLEDTDTLLRVLRVADKADRDMCDAFALPFVDRGLGGLPYIVYHQIEFLQTLESEKT